MKLLKNRSVLAGVGLILLGLTVILLCLAKSPPQELSRTELEQLLKSNQISDGRVTGTPRG
jgi:hypothetical protein